ncbi:sulfatase family protein [Rhodococcus tibetensis]|uniref:Sulfatase n=1 Tax=Rhodococcus tibetensis TaxID=2965064 RepID=A0ABT1Q9A5_9NOCA|nr:sulfatase [Rhodococcus sp. FXJ9.536]MCQ4118836.1 sulfatase [Rhodococcus sp. FXJ9.536]
MTTPAVPVTRDNVLIVHWHDLGRHLGCYGASGVRSPNLDRLAAEGVRLTDAHAVAPLCSPSRGALFSGRYPHSNGLVGLAHHGWQYHDDVQTLPTLLSNAGWYTALFGMQHETAYPKRLGYHEYDVTNSYCDYVTDRASGWLSRFPPQPFLLTAGFFETHRPYPADRYRPADPESFTVPSYLPDRPQVREDLAGFHGSIEVADAAVGRLLHTLEAEGLDDSTWVVFFTDHGEAFPRAKSTLYAPGTGIATIIRPPRRLRAAPRVYDGLFSGVDLVPTLLDLLGVPVPAAVEGVSHAEQLLGASNDHARELVFTEKTFHDTFDPIRAVRSKQYSYIENYAPRPILDLPLDIQNSLSGEAMGTEHLGPRPSRELYDLAADPDERVNVADTESFAGIQAELSLELHAWRRATGDAIPSDEEGTAYARTAMEKYLAKLDRTPDVRSAYSAERGILDEPRNNTGT